MYVVQARLYMFERVAIVTVLFRDRLRCDVVLVLRVLLGNGQEDATPVLVAEYFEQFIQCAARRFVFFLLDICRWLLLRNASLGDAFRATVARREMDDCERVLPFQAALTGGLNAQCVLCSVLHIGSAEGYGCG
jgi:hypothetical protein